MSKPLTRAFGGHSTLILEQKSTREGWLESIQADKGGEGEQGEPQSLMLSARKKRTGLGGAMSDEDTKKTPWGKLT